MNKPKAGISIPRPLHPTSKGDKPAAAPVLSERHAARKPTGPVIYKIEKGANVWPGRR